MSIITPPDTTFQFYSSVGNTANFTITIAAAFQMMSVQLHETAGNAITGGLRIGTTDGGTDVVVAQAVGSGVFLVVPDAALLKRVFSTSVDTILYCQAVGAWNSASLNVGVIIGPAV